MDAVTPAQARVVPTGPENGYGPGRWLAQYRDTEKGLWFDVGDPHDTEKAAHTAAADYRRESRS